MKRLILVLCASAIAGFAAGLLLDRTPALAQRLPFDAAESVARHGRRYVVPSIIAPGAAGAAGTLRITNHGFRPTNLAIVQLAAAAASPPETCGSGAGEIVGVRCVPAIAMNATAEVDLTGMDGGALIIYSLDPNASRACGELSALPDGALTLAEWEAASWHAALGERIAVAVDLVDGGDRAAMAGIASSGLDSQLRNLDPFGYAAVVPRWSSDTALSVVSVAGECAPVRAVSAPESAEGACPPATSTDFELPPFSTSRLTADAGPARGLALLSRSEIIAATDRRSAGGWASASAPVLTGGATSGQIAFPVAVGPVTDARTTLWVTNQHVTATAQIDLLMWDGNGSLRVPFADPTPLCAGSTRAYDINAIAGEIPPTTGRGDAAGPPLLSLRVESTGYGIETAPPIGAQLEIESPSGTAAYAGLSYPTILGIAARLGAGGDRPITRGFARGITIVPGVMVNFGPERRSTMLAIQVLNSNAMAERQARIDLYDLSGALVVADVRVPLGIGPAGFLDLSTIAGRLGDSARAGFLGTAVVRGGQNQGTLGVVALTRQTAPSDRGGSTIEGDQLTLAQGSIVLFETDPSIPTPTPLPTRAGPTATPTPGPDEPTPTMPADERSTVHLPFVNTGG